VGTLPTNNQITAWAICPPYNTTGADREEKDVGRGFSPTKVGFKPDLQMQKREHRKQNRSRSKQQRGGGSLRRQQQDLAAGVAHRAAAAGKVQPGEILAITFTRKAAQEMQERLHDWLHELAAKDDDEVRDFLKQRAIEEVDDAMLARARGLYRDFLLSSSSITISTFHGWFMQIIQRAPLNAGVPVGLQLLERTAALRERRGCAGGRFARRA
jgi:hypothetical protein